MDAVTINLFLGCTKLQDNEDIVYAEKKGAYNNIDDWTMYYKVITINKENGEVRKYTHMGHVTNKEPWYFSIMH